MKDNKSIIIIEPKPFHFVLTKDAGDNMKHEIDFIIKHNELLVKNTIKNKIRQLLSKYKHGTIFINKKNIKKSEPRLL